ncbi:MAG: DUF1007 family protein [Mesorhizobium sp.]
MPLNRLTKAGLGLAAAALVALPVQLSAHPHIFAEARLDVVVAADGTVTGLRNLWRFDDLFSSTVLFEFDENKDMKLDDAELHNVSQTIYNSLAEYDYFQFVTANGKDVGIEKPAQLIATLEYNQLVVLFEVKPATPLKLAGKVEFGIYDPTFYTAIDYTDDNLMALSEMPAGCSRKVVRPDPDEAIAQNQATLTEEFFNDPTGNDLGKIFATRLEITCPPQG